MAENQGADSGIKNFVAIGAGIVGILGGALGLYKYFEPPPPPSFQESYNEITAPTNAKSILDAMAQLGVIGELEADAEKEYSELVSILRNSNEYPKLIEKTLLYTDRDRDNVHKEAEVGIQDGAVKMLVKIGMIALEPLCAELEKETIPRNQKLYIKAIRAINKSEIAKIESQTNYGFWIMIISIFINTILLAISFSLGRANNEVSNTNSELTKTNSELTKTNSELTKTNSELTKTNSELTKTNSDIKSHNADLEHKLEHFKKHEEKLKISEEIYIDVMVDGISQAGKSSFISALAHPERDISQIQPTVAGSIENCLWDIQQADTNNGELKREIKHYLRFHNLGGEQISKISELQDQYPVKIIVIVIKPMPDLVNNDFTEEVKKDRDENRNRFNEPYISSTYFRESLVKSVKGVLIYISMADQFTKLVLEATERSVNEYLIPTLNQRFNTSNQLEPMVIRGSAEDGRLLTKSLAKLKNKVID